MKPLRRVAVLGAGTMGARIAAHFANAGFPVDLLDIVLPGHPKRNQAALAGIESAAKQRPVAFFTEAAKALIAPGNFEDDLDRVRHCEWIVEAVSEDLEIKRALWRRVAELRAPGSIVSTNTSGIPLAQISEGFHHEFRQHFLGTHFFNPPRYLHLAEVIPGVDTHQHILAWVSGFCDLHLGKGVVRCKDTPNFIGNRIGCFWGVKVAQLADHFDFTVEEVDALTGPLIGLPKSANFRLIDIVGLDVWVHVLRNLYDAVPSDPARELFRIPPAMQQMLDRGWLGEKRGQGFYQRVGKGANKDLLSIDRKTLEYRPLQKVNFAAVEEVRGIPDLGDRLRALVKGREAPSQFLWQLFRDFVLYAARMVPEISGRIVELDRAMRWGYGFALGPFELWDALGVPETVERMRDEGLAIPGNVERMLATGAQSFYQEVAEAGEPRTRYFDLAGGAFETLERRPGVLVLDEIKRARGVVKTSPGASLIDLGDGVLCLEFHSKMNALEDDMVLMVTEALDVAERSFAALVIANDGANFSLGANLLRVLEAAKEGRWQDIDASIRRFQAACMAIKYASRPVVAAAFGMAVGGGCELVLHAGRTVAAAETYLGLVETGVGLIPAGGGCKEMLLRLGSAKLAFDLIGSAKVSDSAPHARELGFLRACDSIAMNRERLTADAKAAALAMVPSWASGMPRHDIAVEGAAGFAPLKMGLKLAVESGHITEYDSVIGEKLAHVLCGGRLTGTQKVSEQYLLDLEREAFLSLCGEPRTQERMQYMLK